MSDTQTKPKQPKHMSADTAAQKFADILKWRLQPATPNPTLKAVRYDRDRITGTPGSARLPFPVDTISADQPTANGVETTAGINTWIELWGSWLAWALDLTPRRIDGAWLLSVLQDNKDLHPLPDPHAYDDDPEMHAWAELFLTDWDRFTHELTRLWWRIGDTTGNTPTNHGPCTYCGQGTMQTQPTNQGHTDQATCTHCKQTINTHNDEETKAAFRSVLRQPNREDWVTLTAAHAVWPALRKTTIIKWAQRGHIRKQDGLYHLGDINTRQQQKTVTNP